ncbi:hypothetical protein G3N30_02960 [Microbacterium lacticum]|uniref:hypothetical protein n=1 Tax=Microbacterium lacticum TaxID=33885 RepID=UPI0018B0B24B|nr:hypothetical protein [Microbacterium lacticum]MBF9335230.1 hypothetical protein [Microbacterium lacticum]
MPVSSHFLGEGAQQRDRFGGGQALDGELHLGQPVCQQRRRGCGEGATGLDQRVLDRAVEQRPADVARRRRGVSRVEADAGDGARRGHAVGLEFLTAAVDAPLEVLDVHDHAMQESEIAGRPGEVSLAGIGDRGVGLHVAEPGRTPGGEIAADVDAAVEEPVSGSNCDALVDAEVLLGVAAAGGERAHRGEVVLGAVSAARVVDLEIDDQSVAGEADLCERVAGGLRPEGAGEHGQCRPVSRLGIRDAAALSGCVECPGESVRQLTAVGGPVRERTKIAPDSGDGGIEPFVYGKLVRVGLRERVEREPLAGEYGVGAQEEVAEVLDDQVRCCAGWDVDSGDVGLGAGDESDHDQESFQDRCEGGARAAARRRSNGNGRFGPG